MVFTTGTDRTGSKLGEDTLRGIVSITDGVYRAYGVKLISLSGFIYLESLDVS